MKTFDSLLIILLLFTSACDKPSDRSHTHHPEPSAQDAQTGASAKTTPSTGFNFLVIVADDLGVDALDFYKAGSVSAKTPTLEQIAADGVTFESSWTTPACTTTRAALLSGLHGFESQVDYVPAVMPDSTRTIAQRLKQDDLDTPYVTGAFGKWHLGGGKPDEDHPATFGFDRYAGNLGNLKDYNEWTLTEDGESKEVSAYHTTQITNLALEFIQNNKGRPWLAYVAYAAPHMPFHAPPHELLEEGTPIRSPADQYAAMVQAMDDEIGRLLDNMDKATRDKTVVMFIGDNGTPARARDKSLFDKDHVKGSLYEGGIRTPLIVGGTPVASKGKRDARQVNVTDLFATVVELAAGRSVTKDIPSNSVSFASALAKVGGSPREYNYSEWSTKTGEDSWTVRNATHKVIQHSDGRVELFRANDLSERTPVDDAKVRDALLAKGRALRAGSWRAGPAPQPSQSTAGDAPSACARYAGKRDHHGHDVSSSKKLVGSVEIRVEGDRCLFSANGIPDHDFGLSSRSFPHAVAAQKYNLSFPLSPRKASSPTPLTLQMDNGVLLNGVKIDILAAACFGVGDEKIGCNDMSQAWRFDPVHPKNTFRVDAHHAHTQPNGAYHYHGVVELPEQPTVIGFAADGFPIRSPWVRTDGKLKQVRSSYVLKKGARTPLSNQAQFPGGNWDGTFRDDWQYEKGAGDLDICNGGDFGDGYSYYATETFPYFLACFTGTPDPSFSKRAPDGSSGARPDRQRTEKGRKRREGQQRPKRNDR